jgi:hypothetical protein
VPQGVDPEFKPQYHKKKKKPLVNLGKDFNNKSKKSIYMHVNIRINKYIYIYIHKTQYYLVIENNKISQTCWLMAVIPATQR